MRREVTKTGAGPLTIAYRCYVTPETRADRQESSIYGDIEQ